MKYKIALTSTGPLSGKSTLAKHLESEYGLYRADHSRTLVREFVLAAASGAMCCPGLTVEKVYEEKEKWRQALQTFGYEIGFNDPKKTKYWAEKTITAWTGEGPGIVFDSFRGEVQAQALRALGFVIVQIEIDEDERRRRAEGMGRGYEAIWKSMQAEPELELGIAQPDITLNGALPTDVQARILLDRPEVTNGYRLFGSTIKTRC